MNQNPILEGKIRTQLILLTLPLIAGELLQQLYNTVDSLIIGHFLGTDAFAASGVSGSIMNLFIFILSGFCVGVSVLFSNEYGGKDFEQFRKTSYTAALFGSIFTVLLSIVFLLLTNPVLRLVATPEALMPYCRRYLTVILAGLIATYCNNLFTGILRSVGATRISLMFLTLSLISNTILDIIMVQTMDIFGAALATVLAQVISALGAFLYIRRHYPELLPRRKDMGFYPGILRRIFSYGITSALHMSSLYIGKFLIQRIVNGCGTHVIAAFTASTRIEAFISAPGNGFAQASSIFTAQNLGAGNTLRVKQGLRESFRLILSCGIVLAVGMYFVSPYAVKLFLDASETAALAEAESYLKLIYYFYGLSYTGYFFVGCSRGFGKMSVPFVATTIQIAVRVLCSRLLIGHFGLSAVAWATGIGWVFVVAYHLLHFFRYTKPLRNQEA